MTEENNQTQNATPEYIERMINEHNELAARFRGLREFIESGEGEKLGRARHKLLVDQANVMQQYLEVLVSRIEIECIINGVELTMNDEAGSGENGESENGKGEEK